MDLMLVSSVCLGFVPAVVGALYLRNSRVNTAQWFRVLFAGGFFAAALCLWLLSIAHLLNLHFFREAARAVLLVGAVTGALAMLGLVVGCLLFQRFSGKRGSG